MTEPDPQVALARAARSFPAGPVALLFDEDGVALRESLDHLLKIGFAQVVLCTAAPIDLTEAQAARTLVLRMARTAPDAVFGLLNRAIPLLPGRWIHYCYNAEFLHYPFCETRSVGEMLAFHAEERRQSMLTYVVDLYAGDLSLAPNAVDLSEAWLDRSGYYAQNRADASGRWLDRQWDFYGGLRWRFEEHVPEDRRRIDRIALFRSVPGLEIRPDHTTSLADFNTVSCEWHHNLTAALASFRVAKALRTNPGSRHDIASFLWHNSVRFEWSSRQLMDLGLMEPGQWF